MRAAIGSPQRPATDTAMSDDHATLAGTPMHDRAPLEFAQPEPSPPTRDQDFDLLRLVEAMPRLGAVLWLERRERRPLARHSANGAHGVLRVEHPALAALTRSAAVTAHCAVTPNGPREWLCFHDHAGIACAKLFLLPDTDYLAWDEMTIASRIVAPSTPAPPWQAHGAFLRGALARLGCGWRARVLTFELKRMPWLRTLAARPPLRISLFGFELARAIASDEGAELVTPLHAA
jgi:hypothetical protein